MKSDRCKCNEGTLLFGKILARTFGKEYKQSYHKLAQVCENVYPFHFISKEPDQNF